MGFRCFRGPVSLYSAFGGIRLPCRDSPGTWRRVGSTGRDVLRSPYKQTEDGPHRGFVVLPSPWRCLGSVRARFRGWAQVNPLGPILKIKSGKSR